MENELLIRIGTVDRGNSVTMISDAAVASRKTYDTTVIHIYVETLEMIVPKCCPITYTKI